MFARLYAVMETRQAGTGAPVVSFGGERHPRRGEVTNSGPREAQDLPIADLRLDHSFVARSPDRDHWRHDEKHGVPKRFIRMFVSSFSRRGTSYAASG